MIATQEISKGVKVAGRYTVLRRLGSGGMATVFLAEDERLGRQVAIKRLHTDAPEASVRRFRREARLGAALNHPNLVAVYDSVVTEEGALIVMEYVPGTSLADLAGGRKLRPKRALPILRAVAEALDHAHAEGVVHRDVKPANVLVRDDDAVKLADLGIARAVGASQITSDGNVIGTLPYMAPERLAGPGAGGPESDVYALAAVAYEVLSGQPPSEATSTEAIEAQAPPDLLRDWPKAPPAAAAVLARGLDPDPERRPPSAGRLVDDLERGLAPGAARETTATTPFEPPPTRPSGPTLPKPAIRPPTGASWPSRGAGFALLLLGVAAVVAVALASGGGDGSSDSSADGSATPAAAPKEKPVKEEKAPEPAPSPTGGVSNDISPAQLNDLGFALSNQGRYDEAIPLLERAVAAFPEDSEDITYAFALFNLGHALRMAGRPEEAIPVLEQRLKIHNQTDTVKRELEAAKAEADGDFEGDSGHGNGEANGHEKHD
jgi:serine/threonine-protein kinase